MAARCEKILELGITNQEEIKIKSRFTAKVALCITGQEGRGMVGGQYKRVFNMKFLIELLVLALWALHAILFSFKKINL